MFSPYYAWSRRHGTGDPLNHCAINVALYGPKKRWTMTERGAGSLQRSATALSLSKSTVSWDGNCLRLELDELGMPLPKPVRGVVSLYPRMTVPHAIYLDHDRHHSWQPIAPAARVEVSFDRPDLNWSGDGYLDSNAGDVPLEQSFNAWDWSRVTVGEIPAVLYDTVARDGRHLAFAAEFDRDGRVQPFEPPPVAPLPTSKWRVARQTRSEPGHAPAILEKLEDGPFYARSVISTGLKGQTATGVHESLSLDRFSRFWVQSLLPFRMPRAPGFA